MKAVVTENQAAVYVRVRVIDDNGLPVIFSTPGQTDCITNEQRRAVLAAASEWFRPHHPLEVTCSIVGVSANSVEVSCRPVQVSKEGD